MIVETTLKAPPPAWREPIDRHMKPVNAPLSRGSFDPPDDDPPPAAPAARPWPRVFPGL